MESALVSGIVPGVYGVDGSAASACATNQMPPLYCQRRAETVIVPDPAVEWMPMRRASGTLPSRRRFVSMPAVAPLGAPLVAVADASSSTIQDSPAMVSVFAPMAMAAPYRR